MYKYECLNVLSYVNFVNYYMVRYPPPPPTPKKVLVLVKVVLSLGFCSARAHISLSLSLSLSPSVCLVSVQCAAAGREEQRFNSVKHINYFACFSNFT